MLALADYSHIGTIETSGPAQTPPAALFGAEPAHTWCYYYEKAELALQTGDYQQVADLDQQAEANGYHPIDRVEWLPFIQAYAVLGDEDWLRSTAPKVNDFPYLREETCQTLTAMQENGVPLNASVQALVDETFCKN